MMVVTFLICNECKFGDRIGAGKEHSLQTAFYVSSCYLSFFLLLCQQHDEQDKWRSRVTSNLSFSKRHDTHTRTSSSFPRATSKSCHSKRVCINSNINECRQSIPTPSKEHTVCESPSQGSKETSYPHFQWSQNTQIVKKVIFTRYFTWSRENTFHNLSQFVTVVTICHGCHNLSRSWQIVTRVQVRHFPPFFQKMSQPRWRAVT